MTGLKPPIVHVIIVGFHHKKGCQVEYAVPPLIEGNSSDSNEIPEEWKSLPSIALPDGAHNYNDDTVFFHLPSLDKPSETLYGVSCYRQINTAELVNLSTEVTRNSVQKSVCVLSRLPLYGVIQSKLELITHAYFEGRDLTQHDLMEQMYHTLNGVISTDLLHQDSQIFFDMSCRSLFADLQQQLLMLFKLIMLEKRVLFFSSPVKPVCSVILTLLSLFPDLLQTGLSKSTRIPTIKIPPIKVDPEIVSLNYANMKNPILLSQSCHSDSEVLQFSRDISDFKVRFSKSVNDIQEPMVIYFEQSDHLRSESNMENDQEDFKSISSMQDINFLPEITKVESKPKLLLEYNSVGISEHFINENIYNLSDNCEKNLGKDNNNCLTTVSILNEENNSDLNNTYLNENILNNQIYANNMKKDVLNKILAENVCKILNVNLGKNQVTEIPKVYFQNEYNSDVQIEDGDREDVESLLSESDDAINFNSDRILLEVLDDGSNTSSINNDMAIVNEIESTTHKLTLIGSDIRDKLTNLWGSIGPAEAIDKIKSNDSSEDIFIDCVEAEVLEVSDMRSQKDGETTVIYDEIPVNKFGFPLSIFTNGVLCHPYLSLHMFDILTNVNVSGFLIGASNALFLQKMQYLDATFELSENQLNIPDGELRKCLQLSTADLRFIDHLFKTISMHESQNAFLNSTEWEGGDDWVRNEFRIYLLSLLSAVSANDERLIEDFNLNFVNAWKLTNNYAIWSQNMHTSLIDISPEHPCRGQLSVNDVKLRFNQALQNVDKGKRFSAAINSTGRVVAQTGKVFGSAVTSARSTVSGWFSSLTGSK